MVRDAPQTGSARSFPPELEPGGLRRRESREVTFLAFRSRISQLTNQDSPGNWEVVLGTPPHPVPSPTAGSTPMYFVRTGVNFGSIPNDSVPVQISPTGNVEVIGPQPDLMPVLQSSPSVQPLVTAQTLADMATEDPTSSGPVWIAVLVPVNELSNVISIDADFTSGAGAEGLLSVYRNGNFVAKIDERYALSGAPEIQLSTAGSLRQQLIHAGFPA